MSKQTKNSTKKNMSKLKVQTGGKIKGPGRPRLHPHPHPHPHPRPRPRPRPRTKVVCVIM
jgi:hypothetical protein